VPTGTESKIATWSISTGGNDAFLNNGYPAFLVIENSLPDFWDANKYFHAFEDASDR
jgi:hypothetical protein